MYHAAKWHYFMLDFCYYCQIVTMFCLYAIPQNQIFFRIAFALTYVFGCIEPIRSVALTHCGFLIQQRTPVDGSHRMV